MAVRIRVSKGDIMLWGIHDDGSYAESGLKLTPSETHAVAIRLLEAYDQAMAQREVLDGTVGTVGARPLRAKRFQ